MRISTKVVLDFNRDDAGEVVERHSYEYDGQIDRLDRGAVKQAKTQGETATGTAGQSQANANIDRSSVIPGLIRDANNPVGLTPTQRNNELVATQQAAGGGNAAVTGEGRLAALRTRTAGGFAPALAEAARSKGRTLASGALDVANQDTALQNARQQQARQQLLGLYGTDTSNMLHSMGIADQDLNTQLQAGRQGWLQDTEGVLNTVGNMGKNAAKGPLSYV